MVGLNNEENSIENNTYENIIFSLQEYCEERINKLDEEMTSVDKEIDEESDEYFGNVYEKEVYELISNKFFKKENQIEPQKLINDIKVFIKSRRIRMDNYLKSIDNIIVKGDLDAIEADRKTKAYDYITTLINNDSNKETYIDSNKDSNETNIESNKDLNEEKSLKISSILDKIHKGESIKEDKIEKNHFEKLNIDEKIDYLYNNSIEKAELKDGEPDGIIKSYIEDIYNPENTNLDKANLLLNLLVITRMQEFEIMDWYFSDKNKKIEQDDIDLSHKWWKDILNDDSITKEERYVNIVNKTFGLNFYSKMFNSIAKNSNRSSFNKRDYKLALTLSDDDVDIEECFLKVLYKQMEENSLLIVPEDMIKWVNITETKDDKLGDNGQIKHIGYSNGRIVYSVNTEEIRVLKSFKKGVIWVNSGNEFIIEPTKPIVYFNTIENPFLEKPILSIYSMMNFNFKMDSSTIMFVNDLDI